MKNQSVRLFTIFLSLVFIAPGLSGEYKTTAHRFAWGLSARQGRRITMEDTHIVAHPMEKTNNEFLFGIFDGHGGKKVAEYAQEKFIEHFEFNKFVVHHEADHHQIEKSEKSQETKKLTRTDQIFLKTFARIEDDLKTKSYADSMGSTAVVGHIEIDKTGHKILTVAWLGDSRAILVDKNNNIDWESRDHKPINLEETERIEKNGGKVVCEEEDVPRIYIPGVSTLLAVSRAFGDFLFKQPNSAGKIIDGGAVSGIPEIHTIKLTHDHKYLIIACDGVWDVIDNEKAAKIVSEKFDKKDNVINITHKPDFGSEKSDNAGNSQNALDAAAALRDAAFANQSGDNISVIVVGLDSK